MSPNNPEWLSQYSPDVFSDVDGAMLDAYAVALEGWRRGLKLKWYSKDASPFEEMKTWYVDKPGKLFGLSDEKKEHFFFRTRGDLVSNQAVEIGADKALTKSYLEKNKIPIPRGQRFESDCSDDVIINYAQTLGFPLVIKPTDGSFGRGITVNITNRDEFIHVLQQTRDKQGYRDVIIEEYIDGKDYRLYVVGNKVVGAINRIPPFVLGDGHSTIEELINQKNKHRNQNPRLTSCLIKKDEELVNFIKKEGRQLVTVPNVDEYVGLSSKSNISIGGDATDKLDELSDEVKSIAVNAVKAIPELHHCGVDVLIDETSNRAVVIELNPTAQIGSLLFPVKGKARDVPAAIIDYYFPESRPEYKQTSSVYFPLKEELEPLTNRTAQSVRITDAPRGKLYKKRYRIYGKVNDKSYKRLIKKEALKNNLIGYIRNNGNTSIEVTLASHDSELLAEFNNHLLHDNKVKLEELNDLGDLTPIQVGFFIEGEESYLREEYEEMREEHQTLQRKLSKLEKQYTAIQSSFLLKLTEKIRKLKRMTKKNAR